MNVRLGGSKFQAMAGVPSALLVMLSDQPGRDLCHRFWADGRDRRKVGRRAVRRSYEVTVPSLHRTSPR